MIIMVVTTPCVLSKCVRASSRDPLRSRWSQIVSQVTPSWPGIAAPGLKWALHLSFCSAHRMILDRHLALHAFMASKHQALPDSHECPIILYLESPMHLSGCAQHAQRQQQLRLSFATLQLSRINHFCASLCQCKFCLAMSQLHERQLTASWSTSS